jgi:hypothetical protein
VKSAIPRPHRGSVAQRRVLHALLTHEGEQQRERRDDEPPAGLRGDRADERVEQSEADRPAEREQ